MAFDRNNLIPAYELEFDEVNIKYNGSYQQGVFAKAMSDWAKAHPSKRIVDVKLTVERYSNNELKSMFALILFVDAESNSGQPNQSEG